MAWRAAGHTAEVHGWRDEAKVVLMIVKITTVFNAQNLQFCSLRFNSLTHCIMVNALFRARISSFMAGFAVAGSLAMLQLRQDVLDSFGVVRAQV